MKAITILQPYAHLIVTPQSELIESDARKRCENRKWETKYRGELLIHAGKSRDWLRVNDSQRYPDMSYGCIVGKANLVDIIPKNWGNPVDMSFPPFDRSTVHPKYHWLFDHVHAEGPFCWILEDVVRCVPYPAIGHQSLWEFSRIHKLDFPGLEGGISYGGQQRR